jgi:hypothetical protein
LQTFVFFFYILQERRRQEGEHCCAKLKQPFFFFKVSILQDIYMPEAFYCKLIRKIFAIPELIACTIPEGPI